MLAYLAPGVKAPEPAVIFSKPGCPHCARAKKLLDESGIAYEEVSLGKGITFSTIRAVSAMGRRRRSSSAASSSAARTT
jgi:arsenate reductase-like glutaredoxin family protein